MTNLTSQLRIKPSLTSNRIGKKNDQVVNMLQASELGFNRSNYRASVDLLRIIVIKSKEGYDMVWQKDSKKHIAFEHKRLFFDDRSQCYYIWGKYGKPSILYHIKGDSTKYEDCLVYSCKVNVLPRPRDDFANCFLGLGKHNHLIRRDNLTGRLLNDVILGDTYKFQQMNWQVYEEDVTIQSVYSRKNGIDDKSILQAIIVMNIQPFGLKFMIELKKSVIGRDVTMANASENILILGGSGGKVVLYSIPHLLEINNRLCTCQLGQDCEREHGPVGCCTNGIPLTHDIQKLPPVLFQVKCFNTELFFGGFPFHYIFTPIHKNGIFKVVDIASGKESAEMDLINDSIHPDKCYFHWDESGRIIYESAHAVHVYKFNIDDSNTKVGPIRLQFSMTGDRGLHEVDEHPPAPEPISTSNRPRRSCSQRVLSRESVSLFDKTVFVLDFEDELQLLSILATNFESEQGFVIMYDNITGKMLRRIPLGRRLFEAREYRMTIDMDSIVIIEEKLDFQSGRRETVYVYKLRRCQDEPEQENKAPTLSDEETGGRRHLRRPRIAMC